MRRTTPAAARGGDAALAPRGALGEVPEWTVFTGRSFWSKRRRKTAAALLAVLSLIVSIAIAFKLFDRTVPNNVVRDAANFQFAVFVRDLSGVFVPAGPAPASPIFAGTVDGEDVMTYPGDTRTEDVRIDNLEQRAQSVPSFSVYADELLVCRPALNGEGSSAACLATAGTSAPVLVPASDPRYQRFLQFWTLRIDKQVHGTLIVRPLEAGALAYEEACTRSLTELSMNDPCQLGRISRPPSSDPLGEPRWQRHYRFHLTEEDDGTDQSQFKGWAIAFRFVFQARVQGVSEMQPFV